MKKLLITVLIGMVLFGFSGFAFAMVGTPLNVGGANVWFTGSTAIAANNLTGVTQVDYLSSPYSASTIAGTLNAWVLRDDTDNNLIFAYQVVHSGTSSDGISRATAISYSGYATQVGYNNVAISSLGMAAGTRAPSFLDRGTEETVGAQFFVPSIPGLFAGTLDLAIGETSNVWWVKTDSQVYVVGKASVQDGQSANVPTFAPNSVPEPASMSLLGLGVLGLFGLRKRKVA